MNFSEICCVNIRDFYSCCFKHFLICFVVTKESLEDVWLFFLVRFPWPLEGVQLYVLQNLLLLAKLAFQGSPKHSSCNKVLQVSCLPSRFLKTKFSWISTVCKYLHKQHTLLLSFQHRWLIFFPTRISFCRYCKLVKTTDGKIRIIYFPFRRFLKFQTVPIFHTQISRTLHFRSPF